MTVDKDAIFEHFHGLIACCTFNFNIK